MGVPYLNSTLLHVPHQRALGVYDGVFGGTLSLLEERPDGALPDSPNMGGGKELVASSEVINAVHEHQDYRVDVRALIRARLFDMLIGDWDRHDDQWRWAVHKSKGSTIYKPVPRDRDQAFFTQDGLLPALVNRRWAMRKFQSFGPDIRDISGQHFNARYLDRAYLAGTDWSVWKEIADSMRVELTDAAIAEAIALFPDTGRGHAPVLFLEPIVQFPGPFAAQEGHDRFPPVDELGTVAPFTVLGVCFRHTLGVPAVPGILGQLYLLACALFGEWRYGRTGFHRFSRVRSHLAFPWHAHRGSPVSDCSSSRSPFA